MDEFFSQWLWRNVYTQKIALINLWIVSALGIIVTFLVIMKMRRGAKLASSKLFRTRILLQWNSIQALILVPDPFFNEPGYERIRGTAEGDRVRLEHTGESTCAGYSGGAATCTATYVADARSHLTVFASAEATTITLSLGVQMPGVPLCSESVAGCDSSVELYFESPLGCPMFDNVAFLTKKLFDTTNATATALEVANTSCTSDTEPDVHRRLAPAAASVAFLFHTHGLEEAEKIVALLPADESALASTLNVPVTPGSVKISIRAPSEPSDLHRKPVELLAGFGVPVLIACCLGVLVLISCGIFAGRRRRLHDHPCLLQLRAYAGELHNSLAALALLLLLSSLFPLLWSLVARVLLVAAIACVAVTRRPQQRSE